jgi:hypothetical protein
MLQRRTAMDNYPGNWRIKCFFHLCCNGGQQWTIILATDGYVADRWNCWLVLWQVFCKVCMSLVLKAIWMNDCIVYTMEPCTVHARLALAPLGHEAWKLHLPISWLSRGLVGTDGQSFCSDLLLDIIIPSPNQAFRLGMCLGATPMTCSAHARSHMAWHLGCKWRNKYWWALYVEPETGIKRTIWWPSYFKPI